MDPYRTLHLSGRLRWTESRRRGVRSERRTVRCNRRWRSPPFGVCRRVGCGTVFQLTPPNKPGGSWSKTILHGFPCTTTDGRAPNYDIALGDKGTLYGTTDSGGTSNYGTLFQLTPPAGGSGAWTETVLHNFTGGNDGGYPLGGVTIAGSGTVYGTASYSGVANDSGTAFQLTQSGGGAWTYTVLHTFAGGKDAATPATTLTIDTSGNLYGTSDNGGSAACYLGCGTVFKLTPPTGAAPGPRPSCRAGQAVDKARMLPSSFSGTVCCTVPPSIWGPRMTARRSRWCRNH